MVGSFVRLAAAAAFCAMLAGCASEPNLPSADYPDAGIATPDTPLQCVPYARDRSHIVLYGDASTWWQQAEGRFARTTAPSEGAVMVLHDYAGPDRAHLAVVRQVVDAREIRIDHANWLDDGAIYLNDPVRDVSPDNDWSQVRVYNVKSGAWGAKTYPVQGFIGPGPDAGGPFYAQNLPVPPVRQAAAAPPARQADASPDKADEIAKLLSDDPDLQDQDN